MGFSKLFSCFKKQPAGADTRQVDENHPALSAGESTPILELQPQPQPPTRASRPANAKPKVKTNSSAGYLAFNAYKAQSSRGGESGISAGCDTADPSAPAARK